MTTSFVAGSGSTVTRAIPVAGVPPAGTRMRAVTVTVPVAPPVTRPVESTLPSKKPPEANHLVDVSITTRPAES